MQVSFIIVLMVICTVFQGIRTIRALWEMMWGDLRRDMEQYNPLEILTQILYIVVVSAGVYLLIELKGII